MKWFKKKEQHKEPILLELGDQIRVRVPYRENDVLLELVSIDWTYGGPTRAQFQQVFHNQVQFHS